MNTPTARPENEALLPVEQADRDAAADWHQAEGNWLVNYHAMRRGEMDSCGTVQAFARHRLASTPTALPGAEDVAELIDRIDAELTGLPGSPDNRRSMLATTRMFLTLQRPRASDEVPANPVGEGLRLPSEQEFVSRMSEALALAYRRAGGVAHLARLKNGAAIIRNTAILEAAATYVALAGKSADAASSQEPR